MARVQKKKTKMATKSKANKNMTVTFIVQVVQLISLKLLKLVTHETLNTDWSKPYKLRVCNANRIYFPNIFELELPF